MAIRIFDPKGTRQPDKPTARVFGEVAEQAKLADGARLHSER